MDFYKFMVRVLVVMKALQNRNQKQKVQGKLCLPLVR